MAITMSLDWGEARKTPVQPTNAVVVQRVGDELFVTFGHITPPIEIISMPDDQVSDYVEEHPVVVQQVTRRALAPDIAQLLMLRLQEALGAQAPSADAGDPVQGGGEAS